MTISAAQLEATTRELEQLLEEEVVPKERILLIDRLLENYVFTQPRRARELLEQQLQLLKGNPSSEQQLNYYRHLATLENQMYGYDSAKTALEAALQLVEEIGSLQDRIEIGLDYCATLTNQQDFERATDWLDRCERLLKNMPEDALRARAHCRRGYLYLHTHRHTKAIQKFLQAFNNLSYPEQPLGLRDHYCFTLVDSGLGRIYAQTNEHEKAIGAYQRALDRCQRLGLRGRLAWYHSNLGNALLNYGEYVRASHCFTEAIATEDEHNTSVLAASIANLGFCYIEQQLYEEAETMLGQAEALYQEGGEQEYENLATIAFYRARILDEQEQGEPAIEQLKLAANWAEKAASPSLLADISAQLAMLYAEAGNFEAAYLARIDYDSHTQASHQQANLQRQQEIENLFQAEAREREAEHLKLKASQLQLRALRAQMNPHFLFNCLNSIQSFISTKEASTASKYLARFAMLMRQSLEYTNLEFISLEDEIEFLSNYLDLNCNLRFDGNLTTDIRVDDDIEDDIIGVPTMILQPYVENAVEHGLKGRQRGHIQIDFSTIGQHSIRATITDDGVGRQLVEERHAMDPTRKDHRSRGTEITLSRLLLLQAPGHEMGTEPVVITDLYHEDGTPAGTRVEVIIPVYDLSLLQ